MRTDEGGVKEALLHLHGHRGGKKRVGQQSRSASKVATKCYQERGASCLLWHMLAFVPGMQRRRRAVLEKEVCVYGEGDAAVTFLPLHTEIRPTATFAHGLVQKHFTLE